MNPKNKFKLILLFTAVFFSILGTGVGFIWGRYLGAPKVVIPPKPIRADFLWEEVNRWVVSNGRKAYVRNDVLCKFAERRVNEIKVDWSHNGFRVINSEIYKETDFNELGENLARDLPSESYILTAWLNSPSHARILNEGKYSESCIATDGNRVVQLFGGY